MIDGAMAIKGRWSSLRDCGWLIAALVECVLLTSCVRVAAHSLQWLFSDPRDKHHQYYAVVRLSIDLPNLNISATRYADVYYFTGTQNDGQGAPSYSWPCNKEEPRCWEATGWFFVRLPNGDLAEILLPTDIPLSTLSPNSPVRRRSKLLGIWRDQSMQGKKDSCQHLSEPQVEKDYKLNLYQKNGFAENDLVTIEFERLDPAAKKGRIVDPDRIYNAFIIDDDRCSGPLIE